MRLLPTPAVAAQKDVVAMLKHLLALAEEGRIISIAYCAQDIDGGAHTAFTETRDQFGRIGQVSFLLHKLHVLANREH